MPFKAVIVGAMVKPAIFVAAAELLSTDIAHIPADTLCDITRRQTTFVGVDVVHVQRGGAAPCPVLLLKENPMPSQLWLNCLQTNTVATPNTLRNLHL